MKTKETPAHTQGPWLFDGEVNQTSGIIWSAVAQTRVATSHGKSRDEARRNARLIAAAPDMLAALKQVEFFAGINHMDPKAYGDLVRAVIKKAEGTK